MLAVICTQSLCHWVTKIYAKLVIYAKLGVEVFDNRMDCISSQNLLPALKFSTEGKLISHLHLFYKTILLEKGFFCFPGNYAGQVLHTKESSENDTQGFLLKML